MIYQELIITTTTITLSSVLVIDTLMRPKQIYQNWIRNRGINHLLRQIKASKGHWIIVTGTEKSGKSTILQDKQWNVVKTINIGSQPMVIWQHQENPLWALEISFPDMGGISDEWWHSLKKLSPRRIYYFLTTDECKRFKAKHNSAIETHVILSNTDKIQGFSAFMSEIADPDMSFPIGQSQTKPYTTNYLQESFEKIYAQLQTYGNKLLSKTTHPEMKKIINDFPQHYNNLQLGLNKVIASMPVKQVYCCGQIWQNGTPKMLFSPTLGSDLKIIKNKSHTWRKTLLVTTLLLITCQIVLFKSHLKKVWENQSLAKITKAEASIENLKQKQPFLKLISQFISPKFLLSQQQQDEAAQLAKEYTESIESMTPVIAALDIRTLGNKYTENPKLEQVIHAALQSKKQALQEQWDKASNEEQFLASLHYINRSYHMTAPLPDLITKTHIQTACLNLTNRMSTDECVKFSNQWLVPDFKSVSSFDDLLDKLKTQPYNSKIKPLILELTTWLQELAKNPKRSYAAFEFLLKNNTNRDEQHILNRLYKLENSYPELKNIQLVVWQLLLDEAGKYMNGIWVKTIYPYYVKQFGNHYPIVKNSPKDASLNAFNQFYGTGGLINIYYNSYILPFVDSHIQTFKSVYPGTVFPVKQEHLNYFKSVSAVQTLLYQGDNSPHLEINLSPVYEKETWAIKSNEITMPMNAPVIIGWPAGISQTAFSVYEGRKKVSEYKGIWGFWRWFEAGNFTNNELAFHNHAFKISGQTESDLNWLLILRSQSPAKTLL